MKTSGWSPARASARRWVVGISILTVVVVIGGLNFRSGKKAAVSYGIGPVKFTVDTSGHVTVTLGASFATLLGDFSVEVSNKQRTSNSELIVFRDSRRDPKYADVAYRVSGDTELVAIVDGHTTLDFRAGEVVIDTTDGLAHEVTVQDGSQPTAPPSETNLAIPTSKEPSVTSRNQPTPTQKTQPTAEHQTTAPQRYQPSPSTTDSRPATTGASPSSVESVQMTPDIISVSPISTDQTQTIRITGSHFGSQPPITGDLPCIAIFDTTGSWAAGHSDVVGAPSFSFGSCRAPTSPQAELCPVNVGTSCDIVTLIISQWTDSSIVISGFGGAYGQHNYALVHGDQVVIKICNAQDGTGPADYAVRVA